jgi:tetratricopeptide (TPR) repeat protein
LAKKTLLSWRGLYDLARLSAYMDGAGRAQPLYRAALEQAERAVGHGPPPTAVDAYALRALASTFLWRYRDNASAARALKVVMAVPDSDKHRSLRAVLLYADASGQPSSGHAADVIPVLQKRLAAPSGLSPAEVAELEWALGRGLFQSARYPGAVEALSAAAGADCEATFIDDAKLLLVRARLRAGDMATAQADYDRLAADKGTAKLLAQDKDLLRELRGESPGEPVPRVSRRTKRPGVAQD